jgi:hypothetical protein
MEEWDQGLVHFVITDHKGRDTHQEQMCWHRGRFIARMTAEALKSQLDNDEAKRFKFRLQ